MGSWIKCQCGELVHKNMFCGTDVSLVVEEDYLDEERPDLSAEEFISGMVVTRKRLLECKNCNRIIILDEKNDTTKYYVFEKNA